MFQFGYNSLWNFSLQGSAAVQELLNKQDLTIEELFDEDGLLIELKTMNQKLLDFLLREDNFKKIISTAITEPDLDEFEYDQKKYFKYPFVCADLLSSDSQPIVSEFFKPQKEAKEKEEPEPNPDDEVNVDDEQMEKENKEDENKEVPISEMKCQYLDHLFGFLDIEPVNLTSAGYFAKIVNNLFQKRPTALLAYLYQKNTDALQKMVKRIGSKSVAEFLAKVLTFESSVIEYQNEEPYNTERVKTLKSVIEMLHQDRDIEEINNTAFLVCEVFGKYNSMHNSHETLKTLLERDSIDYLFKVLKSNNQASSQAVALILGNIFAYYILINSKQQTQNEEVQNDEEVNPTEQINPNPTQNIELEDDIPLVAALIDNFDEMAHFIASAGQNNDNQITNQHGLKIAPLGSARLKMLELIIIAMKSNNKKIFEKIISTNFAKTLMELFVKYEWNNMLHNQVEKVFNLIIDGNSDDLKNYLIDEKQANLPDFLMNNIASTEFKMQGKHSRMIRKGYVGHIVKISNKLLESKDPVIKKYLDENDLWYDYVENQLKDINETNKTNFGGKDPRAVNDEETEREGAQLELPQFMQKFQKFFNVNKKDQDNDDDEEEDENKDEEEDEDNSDEEKDEEQKPELDPADLDSTEGKHIIKFGSDGPTRGGRSSFGFVSKIEPKDGEDEEDVDDDEGEKENIYLVAAPVLIDLKEAPVEEDQKNYYENNYWTKHEDSWHNADDVLKEMEL